ELLTCTQKGAKPFVLCRGSDHQNFANTRLHQSGQGVVDHGFVVDRHQLLADNLSERIKTGAAAARQNNAFSQAYTPLHLMRTIRKAPDIAALLLAAHKA